MKHQILAMITIIGASALPMACTSKEVLFKPKAELDPLPNLTPSPQEPGRDTLMTNQWSLPKVGCDPERNRDVLTGSPNVKIAILSTGVDYHHEDLVDRISVNLNELESGHGSTQIGNGKDDDNNGLIDDVIGYDVVDQDGFAFDRVGSGTAAAGIIAARHNNGRGILGVMSDVRIIPVRYINNNGQTNVLWLNQALDAALTAHPNIIFIQAADLQIGGGVGAPDVAKVELLSLRKRLETIRSLGTIVVMGAGNDNSLFGLRPVHELITKFDNVVVVTSSDQNDQKALIANYSPQYVTTAAPGFEILTTLPGNSYGKVSSASYAAAHVAGAIGLVYGKYGPRPYREIINKLLSPGASDPAPQMASLTLGRNRLNILKFVTAFH